ncbi:MULTISPECIES: DUF4397 domain-containing protein [unclassified Planococcus (in: firmicutes)]|uniref:DUF4397 domain-containing protein n=1 Tax=unclassified Planococcus (in: firmicutes) TaxID=2662419 RepID=UPI001F3B04C0|nr:MULTISPECIES: DUF4397 domain-containing protein [unclassified Planococcus (in: firmicutes)]UJF27654.1 DUF4397 domain-containing protein [Planococcus sp. 107-1]GKW47267.1 cell wall anchor [Planococcus sp. NCCP-2050]
MKKIFVSMSVAMVLVLSLLASGVMAAGDMAKVRVVHASPDAPAVDVYVNGDLTLEDVPFKADSGYLDVPAGTHNVEVFAAGSEYAEGSAVLQADLTVEAGKAYTVAAANTVDSLEFVVAEDSMSVTEGKTKIRVGHLSPDAPAVDVGLIGGDAVFSGAEFPGITDYMELDAGTYDLEIRLPDGTQVLPLEGTELKADTVYSVFAVNTADSLEVLALVDYEGAASPDGMPTTGLGTPEQNQMNWVLVAGALAIAAAGSGVFLRKRFQN